MIRWLTPQPPRGALPHPFPSPFDDVEPHPLARAAAAELMAEFRAGAVAPGISVDVLNRPEGGKMFGVLVVTAPDGRVGVIRAFSGLLDGAWEVPGWAPPLFDTKDRLVIEPRFDVPIRSLSERIEALARSAAFRDERRARAGIDAAFAARRAAMKEDARERRDRRHRERAALTEGDRAARRLLDNESRQEDIERRRLDALLRAGHRAATRGLRLEQRLAAMERLRRMISRRVIRELHDTYRLTNARGVTTSLRALFAPGEPPWGAGDCAAPKLLTEARRAGVTPLAMAEFWWGPPPPGGGRVEGTFYPACAPKCGPILPFLLEGIDTAPRRTWKPEDLPADALPTLYEDDRVVAVSKPSGMLSVPARDETVADSVQARLAERHPKAERVMLVHRLDLDTSGVILAALDEDAYRALQEQFVNRTVKKRYIAWIEGSPPGDRGTIALPHRLDVDQRPRQVVDFVHGREAVTDWKVLERDGGRTRVALFPRTGRTHQLRVHAAHADGLAAPIVGDRLYGSPGGRLMLHAESLSFLNLDGRRITVTDPAPF